jgi:NDP-sugar pyrophosphorylase family protein
LVVRALAQRQSVGIYRHRGVWLDVGRPEDFREAVAAFERDPNRFLV